MSSRGAGISAFVSLRVTFRQVNEMVDDTYFHQYVRQSIRNDQVLSISRRYCSSNRCWTLVFRWISALLKVSAKLYSMQGIEGRPAHRLTWNVSACIIILIKKDSFLLYSVVRFVMKTLHRRGSNVALSLLWVSRNPQKIQGLGHRRRIPPGSSVAEVRRKDARSAPRSEYVQQSGVFGFWFFLHAA